jgi:hypothetical protein
MLECDGIEDCEGLDDPHQGDVHIRMAAHVERRLERLLGIGRAIQRDHHMPKRDVGG